MYLSQLILNPRSRQVRSEIADPYEMHRTVMHAFPAQLASTERVLFRLELHPRTGVPTLLIQSEAEPAWSFLLAPQKDYLLGQDELPPDVENPAVKRFDLHLRTGRLYRFRLLANPTVKRTFDLNGEKQKKRLGLLKEADQIAWLKRKLEAAGAEVQDCTIIPQGFQHSRKSTAQERGSQTHLAVLFEGLLAVKDPQHLSDALASGIGAAKGFGFGLLSLAPGP